MGTALILATFLIFAAYAAFRTRRVLAAKRVTRQYLASRPGLYLEGSNPFDAGSRKTNGKTAEHVCSFKPCPHIEGEKARRERHLRVMGS